MPQAARSPIRPVKAAHRGGLWSVPRMRAVPSITSTVSPVGTAPPFSSLSQAEKSTRKAAQQAPQLRQGWGSGMERRQPICGVVRFGVTVYKYSIRPQEEIMELQSARQIIDTLAQGIHPVTGEAMPEDSPYNAPPVIRALFAVSQALETTPAPPGSKPQRAARSAPPVNAGKAWAAEDDETLVTGFDRGDDLKVLADALGRTRFGIEQRLIKLGKIVVPGGGRFGSAQAAG
jgi:hypothetical protein